MGKTWFMRLQNRESTTSDLLESLRRKIKAIQAEDPLLKRGIQADWVCVIHPALIPVLREVVGMTETKLTADPFQHLEMLTGRKTYVMNSAPQASMEYMSPEVFQRLYHDELLRQSEFVRASVEGETE